MDILIWLISGVLFFYVGPMLFMGAMFIGYRFTEGRFPPKSMVGDRIFKPGFNLMWSLVVVLTLMEHLCKVVRHKTILRKYLGGS